MRLSRYFSTMLIPLLALAGCAYVIPPDKNAPRYNTVLGPRYVPSLNVSSLSPQAVTQAASSRADAQTLSLPPVDAATRMKASALQGRQIPPENLPFQVGAAGYPPIDSVPPRPALAGPQSARTRLTETKDALTQDRAIAAERAETLARDAAAEPSMLPLAQPLAATPPASPEPAPLVAPATVVPLPESAPAMPEKPSATLAPAPVANATATAPAAEAFSAPEPLTQVAAPAVEKPQEAATSKAAVSTVTQEVVDQKSSGAFDPLSVADEAKIAPVISSSTGKTLPSTSYVTERYIPTSRYAGQRD